MRLQVPHVAGESHRQLVISDGHQHALTFEAGDGRDRVGQSSRFAQGSDVEHGGRPAVQHDPVVDVPCGKELPPALRSCPASHPEGSHGGSSCAGDVRQPPPPYSASVT